MDIQANVSPAARERVAERLDAIIRDEGVRILFAIESGSRAWGFPSPDSDYDVRFVYAQSLDWYLSVVPGRDVIERPIADDMDVGGWDVKKALLLMCRSNATPLEWLASPIIYRGEPAAVAALQRFADTIAGRIGLRGHYLSLGRRQFELADRGDGVVKLKRYFYALRPACALAWLRQRPADRAPMSLFDLMDGIELPDGVRPIVDALVEQKRVTAEFGVGPRLPVLDRFIEAEFGAAQAMLSERGEVGPPPIDLASAVFRDIVMSAPTRA